jgi:hypothetical protein
MDGWVDTAYDYLKKFVAGRKAPFIIYEVREAAENSGVPHPYDYRMWSQVALKAQRDGIIQKVGLAPTTAEVATGRPVVLWAAI